jgi:molybdate transport system ATP-binding protein
MKLLFEFQDATICRGATPVLRELYWSVQDGEAWAIVGPTGCWKSTLAETLVGRHHLTTGTFTHQFPISDLSHAVRFVPFREQSRLFSPEQFYYQQRFEFGEPDDCPTVRQYLTANRTVGGPELTRICEQMRISRLLDLKLIKLSNGQTRRTRLARGLLGQPPLLVLDDPFAGLDTAGRSELTDLLESVVQGGQRLILVTRGDQVPSWITHTLELPPVPDRPVEEFTTASRPSDTGVPVPNDARQTAPRMKSPSPEAADVLAMREVSVRHGGKTILNGINWTVRPGERWAVVGPNGSGKTTLLSLICGDHPQVFANDIRVFGQRRGHGETIWDVKRRIGLVSPELHQYFPRMRTAFGAAATGFFDHLTPQPLTPDQTSTITGLFAEFGLSALARRPWWQLSTGEQRAVLFVRAVVKRPPLLILDEPFQGMDVARSTRLRSWLDEQLTSEQTLLMVTHHDDELPRCVTRRLQLIDGRVSG